MGVLSGGLLLFTFLTYAYILFLQLDRELPKRRAYVTALWVSGVSLVTVALLPGGTAEWYLARALGGVSPSSEDHCPARNFQRTGAQSPACRADHRPQRASAATLSMG